MLTGQEIGLYETLMISLLGMAIAMVSLFLLMLFIMVFSKILASVQKLPEVKQDTKADTTSDTDHVPEEEVAVIAAVLCAETGLKPEQFKISSIKSM